MVIRPLTSEDIERIREIDALCFAVDDQYEDAMYKSITGDAGIAAERRFLDSGVELHADVLKVGHHRSAYSSSPTFIDEVHPRYAIISVGRHNLFGYPTTSTIETL